MKTTGLFQPLYKILSGMYYFVHASSLFLDSLAKLNNWSIKEKGEMLLKSPDLRPYRDLYSNFKAEHSGRS